MEPKSTPLLSEDRILQCLSGFFPNRHPGIDLCRGDDCAMFPGGRKFCVSTDLFLENTHFRLAYFNPEEIGHKSLAVNISDLAACGAKPVAFTLALGLPAWVGLEWLEKFFSGMSALAGTFSMALAGGDLSRADSLHISITVIGEALPGHDFLKRGGGMPGDILFVIGPLGLARVGLMEMEAKGRAAYERWPASCAAHLRPMPQVEAGLMLAKAAKNARPPTLMDISDGIARDLPRLLGHKGELGVPSACLGADLRIDRDMLPDEVVRYWRNGDPVMQALIGGEDYALLGSCAPDMAGALRAAIPEFLAIGKISGDGEITCNGKSLSGLEGFDHFSS